MARARINSIGSGITATATTEAGDVRTLADTDEILNNDTVRLEASSFQFGQTAAVIQKRSSSSWATAITLTLKVRDGTGIYRSDKMIVSGNTTNSSVVSVPLAERGSVVDGRSHCATEIQEGLSRSGTRITYAGASLLGVFNKFDSKARLEIGGFEDEADAEIVTSRQQWFDASVTPQDGKNITVQSTVYRITGIETDAVAYRLFLKSINR